MPGIIILAVLFEDLERNDSNSQMKAGKLKLMITLLIIQGAHTIILNERNHKIQIGKPSILLIS